MVVAHSINPSTFESEAGGSLTSRPALSIALVLRQPRLHNETLFKIKKKQQKTTEPEIDTLKKDTVIITCFQPSVLNLSF